MNSLNTGHISISFFCLVVSTWSFSLNLSAVRKSVFKIKAVSRDVNYVEPWLPKRQQRGSGTGFYIGNGKILTNAHVVAQAKFLTVLRDGEDNPQVAKATFIAHDSDLAILEVEDPSYFKGAKPLKFGGLPKLRGIVSTIGYPRGGEQISVTEGIVSRISYRRYVHSGYKKHILVQVDSAINSGNSGGPVVQGDKVVGVAFQAFTRAENTGYIIPTPVVERFLTDIKDGVYDGHPDHGLIVMEGVMGHPATRKYHKLKGSDGGVKVSHVSSYAPTHGYIFPRDVLLAINGQPIGVDGKVRFQKERVNFRGIFDLAQMGDSVTFKLSRNGKVHYKKVPIKKSSPHPELGHTYPVFPRFVSYAGLVFTPLSRGYLKSWGRKWHKEAPLLLRYAFWYSRVIDRFSDVEDLVVFSTRLPDAVNRYADIYKERIVDKINGVEIHSLDQIEGALRKGHPEFIVVDFWLEKSPMILPRRLADARDQDIAEKYKVRPRKWLEKE